MSDRCEVTDLEKIGCDHCRKLSQPRKIPEPEQKFDVMTGKLYLRPLPTAGEIECCDECARARSKGLDIKDTLYAWQLLHEYHRVFGGGWLTE